MTRQAEPEEEYLAQHLRDALAEDPRVNELGIAVTVARDHVYLSGQVATDERRQAIAALTAEVLPAHELHNDVAVTSLSEAEDMEALP